MNSGKANQQRETPRCLRQVPGSQVLKRSGRFITWLLLPLPLVVNSHAMGQANVTTIIQRSVADNKHDYLAAPQFDWFERDRNNNASKTYEEIMILGSPYERLVAVNGRPVNGAQQADESRKLEETISERRMESPGKREKRIAKYEANRRRDQSLMEELVKAFDFRSLGEQKLNGYSVYVLQATPRPVYQPTSMETRILVGMQGKLWIDKNTFQWVKVEADVIRPVSIEGFLANVEPGTRFELEKAPVEDNIWLAKHFSMRSQAKVLFLFHHRGQEEDSYFNYHKSHAY